MRKIISVLLTFTLLFFMINMVHASEFNQELPELDASVTTSNEDAESASETEVSPDKTDGTDLQTEKAVDDQLDAEDAESASETEVSPDKTDGTDLQTEKAVDDQLDAEDAPKESELVPEKKPAISGENEIILKDTTDISSEIAEELSTNAEEDNYGLLEEEATSFSDTDPNAWYYKAVMWATSKGIVAGFNDGTFRPNDTCTRGQVVTFLWRMAGKQEADPFRVDETGEEFYYSFNDVSNDHIYYKAIRWAAGREIAQGYVWGGPYSRNFCPDDYCTRGQIVTFLWRYMNKMGAKSGGKTFTDVPDSHVYYKAIMWASSYGIAQGFSDGSFKPEQHCTRAQCVAFIYRMAQKLGTEVRAETFTPTMHKHTQIEKWGSLGVTAYDTAIDIRGNKRTDVEEIEYYRSTSPDSGFKKIGSEKFYSRYITDSKEIIAFSFTDRALKPNTKYYYKARARRYNKKYFGPFSNVEAFWTAPSHIEKNISFDGMGTDMTIKFPKVTGAKEYLVHQKYWWTAGYNIFGERVLNYYDSLLITTKTKLTATKYYSEWPDSIPKVYTYAIHDGCYYCDGFKITKNRSTLIKAVEEEIQS